jgi:hypothetical protein
MAIRREECVGEIEAEERRRKKRATLASAPDDGTLSGKKRGEVNVTYL